MQRTEGDEEKNKLRNPEQAMRTKEEKNTKKMRKRNKEGLNHAGVQTVAGRGQVQPADPVKLMRTGSNSDVIMLLINPLMSACLGGQILTV